MFAMGWLLKLGAGLESPVIPLALNRERSIESHCDHQKEILCHMMRVRGFNG